MKLLNKIIGKLTKATYEINYDADIPKEDLDELAKILEDNGFKPGKVRLK